MTSIPEKSEIDLVIFNFFNAKSTNQLEEIEELEKIKNLLKRRSPAARKFSQKRILERTSSLSCPKKRTEMFELLKFIINIDFIIHDLSVGSNKILVEEAAIYQKDLFTAKGNWIRRRYYATFLNTLKLLKVSKENYSLTYVFFNLQRMVGSYL